MDDPSSSPSGGLRRTMKAKVMLFWLLAHSALMALLLAALR
jgi:glutamine synthetase type III